MTWAARRPPQLAGESRKIRATAYENTSLVVQIV
jgi:hypothetical protein